MWWMEKLQQTSQWNMKTKRESRSNKTWRIKGIMVNKWKSMRRSTTEFINNNYSNNFRSVVLQLHLKNSKLIYLTFSLSRLKTIFNISHTKRKAACSFLIPIILLLQVSQQFYKQKKVQAMLQEHLQLFVWMNHLKIAIIMRVNPRRKRMETM